LKCFFQAAKLPGRRSAITTLPALDRPPEDPSDAPVLSRPSRWGRTARPAYVGAPVLSRL